MLDGAAFAWFRQAVGTPTPVQARAWELLATPPGPEPVHALLVAPTGSGKTLAAFLGAIDRLARLPADAPPGVRVLYVSPLKALVHDVEKNLQAPLRGIRALAPHTRPVGVDLRTGDTPERDRRRFARRPAEILVTTPESLFLILGSGARAALSTVELVIVDEIHALADQKRGVHLALSLEALEEQVGRPFQRVGLSATVRPVGEVAGFLAGGRPVTIVDTHRPPRLELRVEARFAEPAAPEPAASAAAPSAAAPSVPPASFPLDRASGWPEAHARILELVRAHRSTLVFVNSRRLCERLALRLNELAGEDLARAHHGSVAREQRLEIEAALKAGTLRALVATGTLELGIDMGAIDHVVLVESPGTVARGLQRVGRAGHQVGGTSTGTLLPRHRADLLESAVIAERMLRGELEAIRPPRNCLDVLAQQLVLLAATPRSPDDLFALVRRAWPYRALPRAAFDRVVDMLSGRWMSGPLADLTPRLTRDPATGALVARAGATTVARLNAGAIPDRGAFGVFAGHAGPRVGELDEEMVFESARGDAFLLGASTWRIEEITRDRVIVSPAPGEPGRMPFWRSDWTGRPIELGRALGALTRELATAPPEAAHARLAAAGFTPEAATDLLGVLDEQRRATGTLPTDRAITVERWPDESGDTRVAVLSPFGARVHAAWAVVIEATLGRALGTPVRTEHGEDGVMLRLAATAPPSLRGLLFPSAELVEDLLVERLTDHPLFAARFRDAAARALLLPRQRPGRRTPLWQQRIRAQNLLATVRAWPDFPILLEAWREVLEDDLDLDGLRALLDAVAAGEVAVDEVETRSPSPLARSLAFRWVSTWLYELDGPAAERRAQVLALDRGLLDALVGRPSWSELLDADTLETVEAELQLLAPGWQARDAEGVLDALRRLGELSEAELEARTEGGAEVVAAARGWMRRARVSGVERWIAADDVDLYRAALSVEAEGPAGTAGTAATPGAPAGTAAISTDPDPTLPDGTPPFEALVRRWARTHGPFHAEAPAARWGVPAGVVRPVLERLGEAGVVVRGSFRPDGPPEWCDAGVLRRLKRRALEVARGAAEALPAEALGRFLPAWQGVGRGRLDEVLAQLEGVALPFADLEARILPARVAGFRPSQLDERGALGQLVWVGRGEGRVALYRRESFALLHAPPAAPPLSPGAEVVRAALERQGASFSFELARSLPDADALEAALWELVDAGVVTNDTFAPLRARGGTPHRRGPRAPVGGRWALVERLVGPPPPPTARVVAQAEALLRRHGVLALRAATAEGLSASALYPALRAMEEAGKARRGLFVRGVGGVQFALPGAVEALRAAPAGGAVVLAATDPANPWGAVLEWPLSGARRAAGARVVLVDGALAAFVERGGRSLLLAALPRAQQLAALVALRVDARAARDGDLHLTRVNGAAPDPALLAEAGFLRDPGGRGWGPPL